MTYAFIFKILLSFIRILDNGIYMKQMTGTISEVLSQCEYDIWYLALYTLIGAFFLRFKVCAFLSIQLISSFNEMYSGFTHLLVTKTNTWQSQFVFLFSFDIEYCNMEIDGVDSYTNLVAFGKLLTYMLNKLSNFNIHDSCSS